MLVKIRDLVVVSLNNYNKKDKWTVFNYLDTSNLTENVINQITVYNDLEELPGRAKQKIEIGDILYSSVRPNQRHFGFISKKMDRVLVSTGFIVLKAKKEYVDGKYLYYFLTQNKIISQLQTRAESSKSSYPSITSEDILEIQIDLPPLTEQNRISNILNRIECQILLNMQMINKLQVLAQATYQRFFLQFELSNEPNQKLAPNNAFRRELPAGWTIKKIKNCIQHINTGLNPRHNFTLNNGNIKYVTVKNLTTNGSISFVGCDTISEETKKLINKRSMVSKGDILFASIAPLGRCAIVEETPKNWEINESVFSVRPIYEIVSTEYLYMFFMSKYFIKKAEHGSNGSIFNGIRISFLEEMDILVPPTATMSTFTMIVGPIYRQRNQIIYENERLDALKRKLLPLLINQQAI